MKILKFYATWCAPCKALSATINSIKDEITLEIKEIDSDENMDMARKYNVRSLPTMIMVDGDKEIKRQAGLMSADQLREFVTAV
jgi:thioredoxin-like negative regulator of GroEL